MRFFLFWWCFDDHLAAATNMPGLGHLPLWVAFLIGFVVSRAVSSSREAS